MKKKFIKIFEFQSRINIYKSKFYFSRFFFKIISEKIYKKNNHKIQLEKKLKTKFLVNNVNLIGNGREGIFYAVKYSIMKLNKKRSYSIFLYFILCN